MSSQLRYNIADQRLSYTGTQEDFVFFDERIAEFNHRHRAVLRDYDIRLEGCNLITLCDRINKHSNMGALRNRQLRQSAILSAALSAIAVGAQGRGALNNYPKEQQTKDLKNSLKRDNDRSAAQIMAEVLQTTTETFPVGEEVLIESVVTEGVRVKPGKEAGGNPTIAVGALYGKSDHRAHYGLPIMPRSVSLLSMGNDVIDGTTKSITGGHSSMTCLFLTESHVKRRLPDIYVQRWMGGATFDIFNPRETSSVEAAEIIASSMGLKHVKELSAFFLDRPRHTVPMDQLNNAGVATPFDKDGDLIPSVLLGMPGLTFPDGRNLNSMIGEIGGSAEWAVGVLPLVWRGGEAIGMLTSQSSLTRKDLSPEQLWKERFHFTEEEFLQMQDARFEQKPYFTIKDIVDDPFAGGIAAFGAITDNYFLPFMKGTEVDEENDTATVSVVTVTSVGTVQVWQMTFKANDSIKKSIQLMLPPKQTLLEKSGKDLEAAIGKNLENEHTAQRFRIFFYNEYYPALIPVRDKFVVLHRAIDALIERGALVEKDREIVDATIRVAGEWFVNGEG